MVLGLAVWILGSIVLCVFSFVILVILFCVFDSAVCWVCVYGCAALWVGGFGFGVCWRLCFSFGCKLLITVVWFLDSWVCFIWLVSCLFWVV